MSKQSWARQGFTLIELLVVIGIIAIISSIILASLKESRIKAKNSARNSAVLQYRTALQLYAADHNNRYPFVELGSSGCLGNYNGGNCGEGNTVSDNFNLSDPDTGLARYIKSFPPVGSIAPFPFPGGLGWVGATYACQGLTGLEDPSEGCSKIRIEWGLENNSKDCGPGKFESDRCYLEMQ